MSIDNHILAGEVGGTMPELRSLNRRSVDHGRIQHGVDLVEPFRTFDNALRSYVERAEF